MVRLHDRRHPCGLCGWAYVSPYFTLPGSRTIEPLGGPLGAELHAMLVRAGLPHVPVLREDVRNASINGAVVLGLVGSRRIVLTDTLLAGDTRPEAEYVVAYELGHIVHHDPLSIALIEGGIIIVFTALAIVIADSIRFRRDDDPISRLATSAHCSLSSISPPCRCAMRRCVRTIEPPIGTRSR